MPETAGPRTVHPPTRWPLLVMGASGCAALGYQVVWTQQMALLLGQEGVAALAVLAALFGGLSLGAACLGGAVSRSARPHRWYAACEVVMGLWALLLTVLLQPAGDLLHSLQGAEPSVWRQTLVTFGGTALLLLPATLAMGATLPAMEGVMTRLRPSAGRFAWLYAFNTGGGVVGVLAAAFWSLPTWGLSVTALLCALLNGACALAVWWHKPQRVVWSRAWARDRDRADKPSLARPVPVTHTHTRFPPQTWALHSLWACTGLLGIGFEVVVLRALHQVAENTVYTLALLLAVYLAGTALGAAAWARWTPACRCWRWS